MVSEKEKKVLMNTLRMYRDRPCLWDHSIKSYANKQLRHEAYTEVLAVYRNFDDSTTMPHLKKKISNMRTNYIRELKKVQYAKKNGQEYVPTLWYYYELAFLKDKHKPREETDYEDGTDKSESDDDNNGNASATEETTEPLETVLYQPLQYQPEENFSFVTMNNTASSPSPSSGKSKNERSHKSTKRPRESNRESSYDSQQNLEEAVCDSFGKSVAVQLKKMYVENALLAQSRIQSILTEIGITDYRQKAAEKQMRYTD